MRLQGFFAELLSQEGAKMFPQTNPLDILVCWKTAKWAIDLSTTAFSEEMLAAHYRYLRRDPERAKESGARQDAARKLVEEHLPASCFVPRGQLTRPLMEEKDLLVMAGGDNHAIWGVHFLPLAKPVVLLNSDFTGKLDSGSHGGILNFNAAEFVEVLPRILAGDYEVEEWTLLEVKVGDHPPVLTVSEVFFGERDATDFSGVHLEYGGKTLRHAGSGPIVATGAGTSFGSWHHSATGHSNFCGPHSPTNRQMYFVARERNVARDREEVDLCFSIPEGVTLTLTSMNDSDGIVRVDSMKDFPFTAAFPQGEVATVRVADERLRVVKNPLRNARV